MTDDERVSEFSSWVDWDSDGFANELKRHLNEVRRDTIEKYSEITVLNKDCNYSELEAKNMRLCDALKVILAYSIEEDREAWEFHVLEPGKEGYITDIAKRALVDYESKNGT